ncbi:MAG TPA: phosphotransferase [candidate division Zixibacteria bacterium]|nr:phosphotransferase [candidate division Zixibacteria bacterium]
MEKIAVTRSIVDARAFGEVLARDYDFDSPIRCQLISKMLRTQDNDHYLVKTDDQKYVARIYQLGSHLQRTESDYLFELELLAFLSDSGIPVSYALPRSDGGFLGHVDAPEGKRYYALFSFAEGKPMVATDEEQLYTLGGFMARIHLVSNDFASGHHRHQMDLPFLVDRPIERLKAYWADKREEKLDILITSAEDARDQILSLLRNEQLTEDGWGPIGGDFHPYNTRFTLGGEAGFFNFDLCGFGWRAYDLAVFLLNAKLMKQSNDLTEAFFAGYYSQRPLSRNEHAAIAPFMTIRRVWLSGTFSTVEGMAGYTFIAPAQLDLD